MLYNIKLSICILDLLYSYKTYKTDTQNFIWGNSFLTLVQKCSVLVGTCMKTES